MTEKQERKAAAAPRGAFSPGPRYFLAVILAWLVPGAGHWIIGQRARAVILALPVLGIFWWGEAQARGYAVFREEHDIFFYGQMGNGLSTLVADRWQDSKVPDPPMNQIDRDIPPGLASGILFTTISGLLNLLLVLQVLDPRSWEPRRQGEGPTAAGPQRPPPQGRGP